MATAYENLVKHLMLAIWQLEQQFIQWKTVLTRSNCAIQYDYQFNTN